MVNGEPEICVPHYVGKVLQLLFSIREKRWSDRRRAIDGRFPERAVLDWFLMKQLIQEPSPQVEFGFAAVT
jgi:hypothetical protein